MDLAQYLDRIGLRGPPRRDAAGLAALQQAHRQAIGFENLDIRLGRAIAIDSASVFAKLVALRRGGYCFEQNRLFSDALCALGLPNRPLLARVRLGLDPADTPPRTHVLLLANVAGERWIADAGFGGSYVPPMPLRAGELPTSDGARHRLRSGSDYGADWLLERAGPPEATDGRAAPHADWQAQYTFDLAQVAQADLELSNHWTSTRPGTRFTALHVASIALPGGFAALTDRRLVVHEGGESRVSQVADAAAYGALLRSRFRIDLADADAARLPLFA
jgi:N-hydroxyarylamine O-acetyltransferase